MSRKLSRLTAVLFAVALLASACGGDSGPSEEEINAAGFDVIPAGLEDGWESSRQAIIDDLNDGDYGVSDGILKGPGGFEVDLSACPSDWADDSGITDGTIKIGHTTALSGNLAAYGNIGAGMEAYFDYINASGGVGPDNLKLELVIKDDEYVATKTQEAVDELLQTEDPFYVTTLGSPNTFSVRGTLNDACVPQPLVMTGHQAWGDPANNPWTTGLQLSYATESLLWGQWIEQNLADQAPITVSALVMDNEFGLAYEQGFDNFAKGSDLIGDVTFVRHDPAAPTLTNEITTLAAAEADVFISMTAGNPCLLAIQEAANAGITDTAVTFTPSVCKAISSYMAPAGDAAEGWYIVGGGIKDSTDPQYDNDPFIGWMNDTIEKQGLDPAISLYATGFGQYGWTHVEAMRIAAELDGGLNRTNMMLALRALDLEHPLLLDGIEFQADGANDSYLIEGSEISQFSTGDQSWIQQGDVIDLNGQSDNCNWIAGSGEGCS